MLLKMLVCIALGMGNPLEQVAAAGEAWGGSNSCYFDLQSTAVGAATATAARFWQLPALATSLIPLNTSNTSYNNPAAACCCLDAAAAGSGEPAAPP